MEITGGEGFIILSLEKERCFFLTGICNFLVLVETVSESIGLAVGCSVWLLWLFPRAGARGLGGWHFKPAPCWDTFA